MNFVFVCYKRQSFVIEKFNKNCTRKFNDIEKYIFCVIRCGIVVFKKDFIAARQRNIIIISESLLWNIYIVYISETIELLRCSIVFKMKSFLINFAPSFFTPFALRCLSQIKLGIYIYSSNESESNYPLKNGKDIYIFAAEQKESGSRKAGRT